MLHALIVREGYQGHYERVKCWVRERRRLERARRRACVRFETAPGLEGQFDWKGPARGLLRAEPETSVHFFRFLLGWSRAQWTLVVRSINLPALLAALRWAFIAAGGVPARVLFDNTKAAVLRPRPQLELQPFFLDVCRHYGCEPDPAWPYHPERKGKTERSYRDIEDAGLLEEQYPGLYALQDAVTALDRARNGRVHGTTGEVPWARLERERPELLALPEISFDPRLPETRRVLSDCTVSFHAGRYSVPHHLVGSRVVVKIDPLGDAIEIFSQAERVAEHRQVAKGERSIIEEHVAALRRPRFERLQERAAKRRPVTRRVHLLSVVPWAAAEVEQRPIAEYVSVLGGVR